MKPLCELSLIVAVSSGPGIIAPEKAMIKEETKIVISSHTVYMSPIPKNIESSDKFLLSSLEHPSMSFLPPRFTRGKLREKS